MAETALTIVAESVVLQVGRRASLTGAEREQLKYSVWNHTRGIKIDTAGTTVERALAGSPLYTIEQIIQAILSGGDLLARLREEHARLGAEIAKLEKLDPVTQ